MVLDSELEFSYFATLFLWRSCAVPRVGIELTTMLGLDPELGSTHFSMGSVGLLANGVAVSAILTHCSCQFWKTGLVTGQQNELKRKET